jgi:hypothetical protein
MQRDEKPGIARMYIWLRFSAGTSFGMLEIW